MTNQPTASAPSHIATLTQGVGLREAVAHALRAAVVSGEMEPGVVYSAPTLSARFGVSPTPVREAMLDLAKEGLVVSVRNKGFRVTQVSDTDLDHITELRLLIEPPTVRKITPRIPAGDFAQLRSLASEIVDAAASGQLIEYVEADRQFHLKLLGYSGNPRLIDTISSLRAQTRLYGLAPLVEGGVLTDSAQEHHELVDLLEQGDGRTAERLMRRHIGHVRREWAGPAR